MNDNPEPGNNARIEAYLDQLLVPLARNLSGFHRDELRRELQAHLWGRVDAYRELGQSEDEAVTEALKQFGGAEDFTRQWRSEWVTQEQRGTVQEIVAAAWPALKLCLPLLVTAWVAARFLGYIVVNALPSTYTGALLTVYGDSIIAVCGAAFFALSLWCGFRQGRRNPRRSGLGMFAALSVTIAAGSALYTVSAATGLDRTVLGGLMVSLPLMAAAWMPTACLAAVLGGWSARQRKRVSA